VCSISSATGRDVNGPIVSRRTATDPVSSQPAQPITPPAQSANQPGGAVTRAGNGSSSGAEVQPSNGIGRRKGRGPRYKIVPKKENGNDSQQDIQLEAQERLAQLEPVGGAASGSGSGRETGGVETGGGDAGGGAGKEATLGGAGTEAAGGGVAAAGGGFDAVVGGVEAAGGGAGVGEHSRLSPTVATSAAVGEEATASDTPSENLNRGVATEVSNAHGGKRKSPMCSDPGMRNSTRPNLPPSRPVSALAVNTMLIKDRAVLGTNVAVPNVETSIGRIHSIFPLGVILLATHGVAP
jgi:hypothetical protein